MKESLVCDIRDLYAEGQRTGSTKWSGAEDEVRKLVARRERKRTMGKADLSPEERVEAAVSMTNVVTQLCIDSIREREPWLTEEQLIAKARVRFMFDRQYGGHA